MGPSLPSCGHRRHMSHIRGGGSGPPPLVGGWGGRMSWGRSPTLILSHMLSLKLSLKGQSLNNLFSPKDNPCLLCNGLQLRQGIPLLVLPLRAHISVSPRQAARTAAKVPPGSCPPAPSAFAGGPGIHPFPLFRSRLTVHFPQAPIAKRLMPVSSIKWQHRPSVPLYPLFAMPRQ